MFSRILLSIATLSIAAPVIAESDSAKSASAALAQPGFILSVDTDGPGADSLIGGNYDAAIASAAKSTRFSQQRSAYLTLCAAYIGKAALDEARTACDLAVDAAQAPITTARVPYGRRDRQGLAKAYSNRAILMTLLGDAEAARSDFALAARQNRIADVVQHNQAVVESRPRLARSE